MTIFQRRNGHLPPWGFRMWIIAIELGLVLFLVLLIAWAMRSG